MKKVVLLAFIALICFAGCKKDNQKNNDLTVDGKPKSDAANNILRIELSSTINESYDYTVMIFATDDGSGGYMANKLKETAPFNFAGPVKEGQTVSVDIHSLIAYNLYCNIYYKGLKVPDSKMDIIHSGSTSQGFVAYHYSYIVGN